ncbi:MAG: alpha/beta hydrolase [Bacteroidales bacterium]|nr:alpha/beta hydrolase [Bacteroidales bacterium]
MEFFATAGNVPVHINDTNAGEKTLILLHGYLETMYVWNEFADVLKDFCRVITIDLPGHGLSCGAPVNTMDFMAMTVKGVLDKCGVEKAYVAGHSMGGYAALAFCRLFPEAAEGLLLIHSNPYPDPAEKAADRAREIEDIRAGRLMSLAEAAVPKMYYSENLRRCDDKIIETIELCDTHDPEGIISCLKGMMQRGDSCELMQNPPVPILAIMGDHDNFMPMAKIEAMKEEFPKVRFEIVENTGHNSFIEEPDKVVQIVKSFIR